MWHPLGGSRAVGVLLHQQRMVMGTSLSGVRVGQRGARWWRGPKSEAATSLRSGGGQGQRASSGNEPTKQAQAAAGLRSAHKDFLSPVCDLQGVSDGGCRGHGTRVAQAWPCLLVVTTVITITLPHMKALLRHRWQGEGSRAGLGALANLGVPSATRVALLVNR